MNENAGIKNNVPDRDPGMTAEPTSADLDRSVASEAVSSDKGDVAIDETIVAMESLLRKINFILSKRGKIGPPGIRSDAASVCRTVASASSSGTCHE